MQYFPSDELIKSIIGTGASTLELPSGSALRVGGQFYEVNSILGLDMNVSGLGGLDTGTVAASTNYYIYIVEDAEVLYLVASLDPYLPSGFPAYRRIGKIETSATSELSVINADLINEVQQSQIETLQLSVSQNASDITTLQSGSGTSATDISNLQTDVGNLQTDVGTLQTDVGTLQTDMSTAQTDIGNLQTQQATNTGNISTNTGNISTNTGNIGTLQTQQTINTGDISTLQGSEINQNGRLDSLETAFDPSLGHKHDGVDAPQILATELSSTGSTGAGQYLASDGTGGATWGDLPDGVATDLSNLTATSINQSLIPNITEARDLGTSSLMWQFVYATNLELKQGINASGAIQLKDGFTSNYGLRIQGSSGISYKGSQINGYVRGNTAGQNIALYTVDGSVTGDIRVRSGDASVGTSGDIEITTGDVPVGQTAGSVLINTGSGGNAGQISLNAPADQSVLTNAPTGGVSLAIATTGYVDSQITANATVVNDSITDGNTTSAPSENAVFDALALKLDASALSNVTNEAQIPLSYLDTATDLGAALASDTKVSSQLAVKTYVDSAIVAAGGANTSLSNLTSPTAVNQHLIPNTDGTRDLGSNTARWQTVYSTGANVEGIIGSRDAFSSANGIEVYGNSGQTWNGYTSIYGQLRTTTNKGMAIHTPDVGGNTGQIVVKTGASGATSGDITLETGTGTTARGNITLKSGADQVLLEAQPTGGAALAVATTQYVDNAVQSNHQISSGSGTVNITSLTAIDVTNLSVTITTKGRPVVLALIPDASTGASNISIPGGSNSGEIGFYRDGTSVGNFLVPAGAHHPSLTSGFDPVAAGTYTYSVKAFVDGGQMDVSNYKLVAYEI